MNYITISLGIILIIVGVLSLKPKEYPYTVNGSKVSVSFKNKEEWESYKRGEFPVQFNPKADYTSQFISPITDKKL
jgi:hypothetical protein